MERSNLIISLLVIIILLPKISIAGKSPLKNNHEFTEHSRISPATSSLSAVEQLNYQMLNSVVQKTLKISHQ